MSTDPKITSKRPLVPFRSLWLKLRRTPIFIFGPLLPAILNERLEEWLDRHSSTLSSTQLSDDTKKRIHLLIEPLKAKLRYEILLDAILFRVCFLMLAATVLLVPGTLTYFYHLPTGYVANRIGLIYLVALVFLAPLTLPGRLAEQRQGEPTLFGPQGEEIRYLPRFVDWWYVSLLFIYAVLVARIIQISPPSQSYEGLPPYFIVLCSLILILAAVIIPSSCVLLAATWRTIKMDRWRNDLTDAMVLSSLLLALRAIQGDRPRMRQRVLALRMLEDAATNFEKGFARAIGRADDTTNAWLLGEIKHRAAGIREIKRDICLPSRDANTQVKDELETLICAAVDGAWAELPTFDPPPIRPGRRRLLIGLVRQALVAFLPLGILAFTKVADVSLDSTISGYLWTSAIGWAILGILVMLDPGLRDRVAAFRDTAESWRSFHSERPHQDR
jgi:hypothetical protein